MKVNFSEDGNTAFLDAESPEEENLLAELDKLSDEQKNEWLVSVIKNYEKHLNDLKNEKDIETTEQ